MAKITPLILVASLALAAAVPVGIVPVGTVPDGTVPVSTVPDGTVLVGTVPVSTVPNSTVTVGAVPVGTVPVSLRHSCARTCSESSKFSYESGTNYVYDYEVSTTFLESSDSLDNAVTVKGEAIVGVIGPCEFVLSMRDISLEGSSETQQFASRVSQKPLRFAYDDGKISDICPLENEEEWVLNFKRGVLSNFQNSMRTLENEETVTEIDITGECKTTYEPVALSSDTTQITKSKLASDCTRTPVGSQTTLPKQFQNMPILSAEITCEQTVTGGIMTKTHCTELLAFKPIAGDHYAATLIKSTMQLTSETSGVTRQDFPNMKISNLAFQNDKSREDDPLNFMTIESLLSELESKSSPVMSKDVPALFSDLVKRLKNLDTSQISLLYGSFKASNEWKFLMDAAPLISTAASTTIMTELVKGGDVTTKEADIWYSSLALVQNPDPNMFIPLTKLINEVNSKNAIIGAASLLKAYCQANFNCMREESVNGLVLLIEHKLGSDCRSTSLEEKGNILVALRALRIVGHWTKKYVINTCFMDTNNPSDIRVAAIEVYKNAPCSYDRSEIIKIYTNPIYDSELRIHAYLSLMACPTEENIQMIKDKLVSETSNQVGTFVWTHLSNLQESASHEKKWIRSLIGEESLLNKFNSSEIHFSRNIESSFYMEELGIGSTVESNIIFGSSSFLPQSGMFNLSFDIFGESINFIEVGGRFEGFELFAKKFFGSDGYYPDKTIEGLLLSLQQKKQEEKTKFDDILEGDESQPEGSYYMRLFGTDVEYHDFHGNENIYEIKPSFDLRSFFMQFMNSGETQYSKSFKFIDTELQYPTISGFPLSLKLNGTANVGIKVDGEFFMKGFNDMDIQGHVFSSAAFEIDGLMTIDTHFAKSGIKRRLNGLTSVMLDGSIKVDGAKVVDISLNMPKQDQIQLLSVKSELIFIKNDIELEHNSADRTIIEPSCLPMVGTQLCSQYGPNQISIFILKTNVHDSYKLRYLNEGNSVSFLIDMPNSAFNRKFYLTFSHHDDQYKLDLDTPWKSIKSTALFSMSGYKPSFNVEITIDNVRTYQGGIELKKTVIDKKEIQNLSIFIMISGQKIIDINGRTEKHLRKHKFEAIVESSGLLPAKIMYSRDPENGTAEMDISINSSLLDLHAKLRNELYNKQLHTEFDLKYNFMRQHADSIKFNLNFHDSANNTLSSNKYTGSVDFETTLIPLDKIHVDTEIMCNYDDLIIKTELDVENIFNIYAKTAYKHLTKNKIREIKFEWLSVSKTYPFSKVEPSERSYNNKHLSELTKKNMNHKQDFKIQLQYSSDLGLVKAYNYFERNGKNRHKQSVMASYTRVPQGLVTKASYYDTLYYENVPRNETTFNWESFLVDRSSYGRDIDNEVSIKWNLNDNHHEARLTTKANNAVFAINANSTYNGEEKFIHVNGESSLIDFKTNTLGGSILGLGAKINMEGANKTVEVNGEWQGKRMDSRISITANAIQAEYRFETIIKKIKADITETGARIVLNLSSNETVEVELHYIFGKNSDVKVTVRTPFGAYTKQELILSFNRPVHNKFSSIIGITWKNMNVITINASGKLEVDKDSNEAMLSVSSINDPSIFGFKQGSFLVEHIMRNYDLDDNIEGNIDGVQVFKGSLKTNIETLLKPMIKFTTVDVHISTSEIDLIAFSLKHEYMNSGNLTFKYKTTTFESRYNLNIMETRPFIEFHYDSPQLTTLSARLARETNGNGTTIYRVFFDIKEKKYIITIEYSSISSSQNTDSTISTNINFPSMDPIKSSMKFLRNNNNCGVNIEMTKFWSDYSSIKYHGSLNLRSELEVSLLMTWISTHMNKTLEFSYKVENESLYAHLEVGSDSDIPNLVTGAQWARGIYRVESSMTSPLFNNKIELEGIIDGRNFNISIKNGFSRDNIYLTGQLIGELDSFEWFKTRLYGLGLLDLYELSDRNKRSTRISSINSALSTGMIAGLNFFSIKVTNPYILGRESSFFMERKINGEFQVQYIRNDNIVDFSATLSERKQFNISLVSAVPGWKFMALTGRLDHEELLGCISGQINEAKLTVSGGGTYSMRNTSLHFNITTPYKRYENISAKLDFIISHKKFNLDIRSQSSQFRVLVKSDKGSTIDIYVPNRNEPTIINGMFKLDKGHFKFSSRYSYIPGLHMEYSCYPSHQSFQLHLRRWGHNSEFHFERTTQKSFSYLFRRDGREFKIAAKNSGHFPTNGTIIFSINNSFRSVPRTISGILSYDRTRNTKTFDLKLSIPGNRNITVVTNYDINLARLQRGNFEAYIKISERENFYYGCSWDMSDYDNVSIKINADGNENELKGKIGLFDTNVSLISSDRSIESFDLLWNFSREYYNFKAGTVFRFVKGNLRMVPIGNQGLHVTTNIQVSNIMRESFGMEFIWKPEYNKGLTAIGTFQYGTRSGSFDSKLNYNESTRSFEILFEANVNHRALNKFTFNCNFSFNIDAIFNLDIDWGVSKLGIQFVIKNITSDFTQQSAKIRIPEYGDVVINFGHDFKERTKKISVTTNHQGTQSYLNADWSLNRSTPIFKGKVEIESLFLGTIKVSLDSSGFGCLNCYEFQELNSLKGEIKYVRGNNFFNFDFKQKWNATEFLSEINLSSSHSLARTAKMKIHTAYSSANGHDLTVLLQLMDRRIELSFNKKQNSVTGRLTTPYGGRELISGSFLFNITNTYNKTAHFKYERGNRRINMDMELTIRYNQGNLKITALTPFEIMKTLNLDAIWRNGRGTVEYKKNNISYRFEGTADFQTNCTSFDLSFTPNSDQPIHIMSKFHNGTFLSGTGNYSEDIAKMELKMLGKRIAFHLRGYRSTSKIVLEFGGESSFEHFRQIELKVDSELNSHKSKGALEIKVDNFYFKTNNSFEIKRNNGYYWRSEFDSSLTNLPGLIIGFECDEQEIRILTVVYGDEREIRLTFKTKQQLTRGFSGTISAPHRGINDASFDVNYKFTNQNQLNLDVNIQLEPGKIINFDVNHNSDGVQARLTSPMGSHRARARRSISDTSFYGEFGFYNHSVSIRGDNLSADSKKGFKLEGEVLGHVISVDCLLQIVGNNYAEGKFLIDSNISGYETFGVVFKFSNDKESMLAQMQINLPSTIMPPIIVKLETEKYDSRGARVHLIVGDREYILDGKYNLLNGYGIEISIKSIHDGTLHKSGLKGKFIMTTMNKFDGNLEIIYPSGFFNMTTMYDVSLNNSKIVSADLTATSTVLPHDILSNIRFNITNKKGVTENSITFGQVSHSINAEFSHSHNSANFILVLETPILDINNLSLKSELKIDQNIKATGSIYFLGYHTFDLYFDEMNKKLVCVIISDNIPGKAFKIDGSITGLSSMDLKAIGKIEFSGQTFSSNITLDIRSLRNINSSIEVTTPFKDYRKLNYNLAFQQNKDINLKIESYDLFPMKFVLKTGKYNNTHKTIVNIETPIEGFEKITLNVQYHKNKTSTNVIIQFPNNPHGLIFEFASFIRTPSFMQNSTLLLIYNEQHYAGVLKFRYKAPYELDVSANNNRFHIMTDSTIHYWLYNYINT